MKIIQMFSPLIYACFTGVSPRTYGDNHLFRETSWRASIRDNWNRILEKEIKQDFYDQPREYEFGLNRKGIIKNNPGDKKFFGFEWKVLDRFKLEYLKPLLLLLFMIAELANGIVSPSLQDYFYGDSFQPYTIFTATYKDNLLQPFLSDVEKEGWNARVPEQYIDLLNKTIFSIEDNTILNRLKKKLHDCVVKYTNTSNTCYNILNEINKHLIEYFLSVSYDEFNNTSILKHFFNRNEIVRLNQKDLPNVNKEQYKIAKKLQIQHSSDDNEMSLIKEEGNENLYGNDDETKEYFNKFQRNYKDYKDYKKLYEDKGLKHEDLWENSIS